MLTLDSRWLDELPALLERMAATQDSLPPLAVGSSDPRVSGVLREVAERLQDNYPYPHPLYAGQMLKPPHPVARLAYMLALWINPNNHALDGGRASSAMEKEAVQALARVVGWDEAYLGHLTGGGTVANLEALWVANQLAPGKRVLASAQAHYTHQRLCKVLGIDFTAVSVDAAGRMALPALEDELACGDVGTVVVTLGSTAFGSVDPLADVLELRERYGFRVHVDAAYGGYFALAADALPPNARAAFASLGAADSFVIDPHKHGLQPYGCGCVLFRDPAVSRFYDHGSPYTYFSSDDLHLGEISLECSRAGASAVALWATQRLLPMTSDGEFADGLRDSLAAARNLFARLKSDSASLTLLAPALDIVVWAPRGRRASDISDASQRLFEAAARRDLHLATCWVPRSLAEPYWPDVEFDADSVLCLRSVLMKPEHHAWLDTIWQRYCDARADVAPREPLSSVTVP